MSKLPDISVLIPIYKVERSLKECVDSILKQTLRDIEVILIDDGSPDNCGKMIDEYAKKDSRVVAIHQKNSGYSAAVNRGIDLAKGEYIGIIESDDWIEPDMYEMLYRSARANKTDVTKGGFYIFNSTVAGGNVVYKNPSGVDLRQAPDNVFKIQDWPKLVAFHASIWSSIYKADFVKKIKIPDTAGASYQDLPFMVDVFCRAKRITVVKRPFVHWRNDPNQGNSTQAKGKKLLMMGDNSLLAAKIIKKAKLHDELKEALFAQFAWANESFYFSVSRKYRKEYFLKLQKLFRPIKNDKNFNYLLFRPFDRYFVNLVTMKSYWMSLVYMHIKGLKYKFQKVLLAIFPTYRTVVYLKDMVQIISTQNESLQEEIRDLERMIADLKKRK